MYLFGKGLPRDLVRAHMWLNLAASRSKGDMQKQIAILRDMIDRDMTPDQIAEAHRLAREWKPQSSIGPAGTPMK
jgi:hypothetical protein